MSSLLASPAVRLLLLSRNPTLYSTARLALSARMRGHRVKIVDPFELSLAIDRGRPRIRYGNERLEKVDAVIPRIGASVTQYGLSTLRQLELAGTFVVGSSDALATCRDKVRCLQVLAGQKIRVPATVSLRSGAGLESALECIGGCPAIVKLQQGTQGIGTMLADSRTSLIAILETLWAMGHDVVLQQYIREAKGRDVRAVVIGGKVAAAMRRVAKRGEFRSNLHRGASAEPIELPVAYRNAAVAAAKAVGLTFAGVDLLETKRGPMVLEVNASPGLEGVERATGIDLAAMLTQHVEGQVRKRRGRALATRAAKVQR